MWQPRAGQQDRRADVLAPRVSSEGVQEVKRIYRIVAMENSLSYGKLAVMVDEGYAFESIVLCCKTLRKMVGPLRVGTRVVAQMDPEAVETLFCLRGETLAIFRQPSIPLSIPQSDLIKRTFGENNFTVRKARRGEKE